MRGFQHLLHAERQSALLGQATGELVDQHDLVVADHKMPVQFEQMDCIQRLLDQFMRTLGALPECGKMAGGGVDKIPSFIGQLDMAQRPVDQEVLFRFQHARQLYRVVRCLFQRFIRPLAGNDQRRDGFVNQYAVGLVDDHLRQPAHNDAGKGSLATLGDATQGEAAAGGYPAQCQPVAQEVTQQFLGGGVDHVVPVGGGTAAQRCIAVDMGDAEATNRKQGGGQFGITRGEVIVGGYHMTRPAAPCRRHRRHGGGQGLAFAGGHLGNFAAQ